MSRFGPVALLSILLLNSVVWAQGRSGERSIAAKSGRPIPVIPPFKARVGNTALDMPVSIEEYMVGPGDIFLVSIVGLDPYLIQATVSPSRRLVIPQIGSFAVQGLNAAEVRNQVIAKISQIYPNYEADCILYGIREIKVSLSGAVGAPGMYKVTPMTRLVTLLRQGGGWKSQGALHRVEIRNGNEVSVVDMNRYLVEGDAEQNPRLRQGDDVLVPYGDMASEIVTVRGMEVKPAYHAIGPAELLSDFLKRWYTSGSGADLSQVEINRAGEAAGPLSIKVKLEHYGEIELEGGDIIYITPFEKVAIVGEVRNPGRYAFQPGFSAADYLTRAGGVVSDGSRRNVTVTRKSGQRERGVDTMVEAGDVITVPRSARTLLVGQTGMVQVLLAIFNIYLTFLAATS